MCRDDVPLLRSSFVSNRAVFFLAHVSADSKVELLGLTSKEKSGGTEWNLETSLSEIHSWSLGDPVRSSFVPKAR